MSLIRTPVQVKPLKPVHLLIPRQFRVWCQPDSPPDGLDFTTKKGKATCPNCLSIWRFKTGQAY